MTRHFKIKNYIHSSLKLLRIQSYYIIALQFIIALSIVASINSYSFDALARENLLAIGLSLLSIACWYINATAINDLSDFEIDKINLAKDQERPLVIGKASKNEIKIIAISAGIIGIAACLIISKQAALLIGSMLVLNWVYSMTPFRVSYRGGLAQLLLPLGYVFFPFTLGFIALNGDITTTTAASTLVGLYLLFGSRVLLKDFRDVKGDKKHGKLTFLLRHSVLTVVKASTTAYMLGLTILVTEVINLDLYYLILPMAFICGVSMVLFNELAKTKKWREQKPLLAPIGRLNTAQQILLLLAFLARPAGFSALVISVIAATVTVAMIWSAYVSLRNELIKKDI